MQETWANNLELVRKELAFWESYLSDGRKFMVGDSFTLADVNALLPVYFALRASASLSAYPNLKRYTEAHKDRKSIAESWPPHWKDTPSPDWLQDL